MRRRRRHEQRRWNVGSGGWVGFDDRRDVQYHDYDYVHNYDDVYNHHHDYDDVYNHHHYDDVYDHHYDGS